MWIVLALTSSIFLASYDLIRKLSLKDNAVIPVLFLGSSSAGVLFLFILLFSRLELVSPDSLLYVPQISARQHLLFFLKSILVGSSWFLAYFALKHLPITIVIPIRSTGPFWTIIGALLIYNERFTLFQWIGIIMVLIFFYIFSLVGRKEGISFLKNKWIFAVIGGTILGATSAMYDKYLLLHYDRMALQTWFSIYMIPVLAPFMFFAWLPNRGKITPFRWKWLIPLIGIALTIADFLYFYALSYEDSLIGVVSILRRSSVVFSFVFGAIIFREINMKRKAFVLIGILAGLLMIVLGS